MVTYKLEWDSLHRILARRGLEPRGRVQQFISSEVLRRSDKYVPFRTGMLKNTAAIGADGRSVKWVQVYSAWQYYRTSSRRGYDALRGGRWFDRMKASEGKDIIRGAAKMAGGRAK